MIRYLTVGLLAVAVAVAGLLAQEPGDEPPLRLKKKNRPAVEEKKEEPGEPVKPPMPPEPRPDKPEPKEELKPKEDEPPAEPEVDEQEVLNRVNKNMRISEDRLANREVNDSTRQVQEDILKDLDDLINRAQNGGQNQQNQAQNNQGGGGEQQQARNRQGSRQQPGMASKKKGGSRSQSLQQARGQRNRGPGQGQGQQQANSGRNPQPNNPMPGQGSNQPGSGGQSQGDINKLSEVYKDVWGHLPETMRQEMNAYTREQFMRKYDELIKQYYTTIAEKGRKKD